LELLFYADNSWQTDHVMLLKSGLDMHNIRLRHLRRAIAVARRARENGNHPDNEPMRLPCREVFAHSGRPVEVIGPLLEDEARVVHEGFWT
jgi:hypothetical protein